MPRTPWAGSTRRQRLPANWPQIVREIKRRAQGRCEAERHHPHCTGAGTDVDHIIECGALEVSDSYDFRD